MNVTGRPSPAAILLIILIIVASGTTAVQAALCDGISEAPSSQLTTVRVAQGLSRPVLVTSPPGDVDRTFIVLQDGRIVILKQGALLGAAFLDISALVQSPADMAGNEEGLLGLAFHPRYDANGWFFIYHTDTSGNNVLARYSRSSTGPDAADPNSRVEVTTFLHPGAANHNGGMIAFSPLDGYLYIGTGDGGSFCDPSNNSQDGLSRLGKLLRLDVDVLPAAVPSTNPFVGDPNMLDEIWALGLRNPWRFSFDRAQGDLYIGDVGQGRWEEIDYTPGPSTGSENYGWVVYEGSECPNPSCGASGTGCSGVSGLTLPVHEYDHGDGCSVTGGYVYRGCRMPDLHGTYFFADFCSAFVHTLRLEAGTVVDQADRTAELAPAGGPSIDNITAFGEDAYGEIYVVDRGGEIFKIVPVLANLEVSGPGADPFVPAGPGWTWEDLELTSSHPVTSYQVYRHDGNGSGSFTCIQVTATPGWPGGDPADPASGDLFSYVITARTAGDQTGPGTGTAGAPRVLSPAQCP